MRVSSIYNDSNDYLIENTSFNGSHRFNAFYNYLKENISFSGSHRFNDIHDSLTENIGFNRSYRFNDIYPVGAARSAKCLRSVLVLYRRITTVVLHSSRDAIATRVCAPPT